MWIFFTRKLFLYNYITYFNGLILIGHMICSTEYGHLLWWYINLWEHVYPNNQQKLLTQKMQCYICKYVEQRWTAHGDTLKSNTYYIIYHGQGAPSLHTGTLLIFPFSKWSFHRVSSVGCWAVDTQCYFINLKSPQHILLPLSKTLHFAGSDKSQWFKFGAA